MDLRTVAELTLGRDPDSVPRARRLIRSALGEEMPAVAPDAELVISELVTNATLHGDPPVTVRVMVNRVVRLEVEDTGRSGPILLAQGPDAMTGRGLSMVAAIASGWGVEARDGGGKVVWAELDPEAAPGSITPARFDVDALLDAWADDDPAVVAYTVHLGPVATDLLLAAKSHMDNVVRELMLMREGEASSGIPLAPELAALIHTVTVEFAQARTEIKRQAAAAAARGDALTWLELHLDAAAAESGERYLSALDQADRFARAAHLLTMAPPPIHRLLRQWYVRAIVDQIRAQARGDTPPAVTPFQSVLAGEVSRLDEMGSTVDRLATLQKVSAELAGAVTVEAMARIAVDRALEYLPVETARVRILGPDAILRSVAWGRRVAGPDHALGDLALDSDMPGAAAVRTGRPIYIRSLADSFAGQPDLAGYLEGMQSGHFVPLVAAGETVGVLVLTFAGGELTGADENGFVTSLAEVLAQALRRADRPGPPDQGMPGPGPGGGQLELSVLAAQKDVLERMVSGESLPAVLEALVEVVASAGDPQAIGSVLLLDPDGFHLRHGAARALPQHYVDAIDGLEIGPSAGSCGTAAFTRRQVIVEDIATDPRWTDFRDLALPIGLRACWSTPIVAGDGELLGTFAIYYRDPRGPSERERRLVDLLVSTASVAIGRAADDAARAVAREELERAHENLQFVLEATTRVATSLDRDDTLRTLARVAVPTLADLCLIDLHDGVRFRRAASAAADWMDPDLATAMGGFPPDPAGDHPAAAALRTGRLVLQEVMDEAFLGQATVGEEHLRLVRQAGSTSCLAIPLAARGRNLGAMTLVMAQPGRRFTDADQQMVEDLGRRVALAIDNTQLYESTREAERRLALVARAGVALTSSLDLETVVVHLCELVTGEIADRCEVHVLRSPEQWWHLEWPSAQAALVRTDRLPPAVADAVGSRSTVITPSGAPGEETATTVPLVAHGEVVGVITLASAGTDGPIRVPAAAFDVIAGRAALAVDNALLYEQERTAAEILQRSLLPDRLPTVPGLRSAARYLPAGARNEIGGDWYDVFSLGPDRLGVVMGDVMGRGIPAASIMGQLRNGLRMLALQDVEPARALTLLNRMLGAGADSPLATVTYGMIDIPARTMALANAGHLPPVLLRGRSSRYLDQKAELPLGALPDTTYTSVVHQLEAGDALVMYTDGLIEQRDRSLEEGLASLLAVTADADPSDPEALCDRVLEAFRRDSDEDDTAALVLVLDPDHP